jgi:hypothetical protein
MRKSSSFLPNFPGRPESAGGRACATVADYLRRHDQLAGMLPNASRLMALQEACAGILPEHFAFADVMQLEKERLTIGVTNQATAARIRQKLPLLKAGLEKTGWPVKSIRIKVRLKTQVNLPAAPQKQPLSAETIEELEKLDAHLTLSGTHPALRDAVHAMMERHRKNAG